jgi:hypothetical protein
MADIVVTARRVSPLPGAHIEPMIAGGAGNVGNAVYVDNVGRVQVADASGAGTAQAIGVVVSAGSQGATAFVDGDAVSVIVHGRVNGFTGMTPGARVYLSDTAGSLADAAGTVSKIMGVSIAADTVLLLHAIT